MISHKLRPWLVRWLYAAALLHFIVGALLPWISALPLLSDYHQLIEQHFWQQSAPTAARAQQIWWMSLFGATVQTVGIWMAALVYMGDHYHSRFAWGTLLFGIMLWAPQDMLISAQASMWPNILIDLLALIALMPPLLCLWLIDRPVSKE